MEEMQIIDPLAGRDPTRSSPQKERQALIAEKRDGFIDKFRRFGKNRAALVSLFFILILLSVSFIAPLMMPYGYSDSFAGKELIAFSWQHPFGTDELGRDQLVRIMYAVQNAVIVAVASVLLALFFGAVIGSLSGYWGGLFDQVMMRFVDIFTALPQLLVMILLLAVMPDHIDRRISIFIAIGVTGWAGYARLIRGQVLQAKQEEYVEAARALGAKPSHILRKYILPNIAGPIIVSVGFGIPTAMMAESGMSLLGLGLEAPMPSWGNLIYSGSMFMFDSPYLVFWPAFTFALTLLAFTFISDGLGGLYGKEK